MRVWNLTLEFLPAGLSPPLQPKLTSDNYLIDGPKVTNHLTATTAESF